MSTWKILPFPSRKGGSPILLVKARITSSDYSVEITDLSRIWAESLDKRAIIRRALDEYTSIDPTDGPDQLKKFLDQISRSLDGEEGTSLQVSKESTENMLILKLTAELPAPFQPFKWQMQLSLSPRHELSKEMIFPLLGALSWEKSSVSSLVETIKEKDSVMTKLIDKLDNANVDLASIFPSAAPARGSKASNNAFILRAVPGLKEFDLADWKESVQRSSHSTQDAVLRSLFKNGFSEPIRTEWEAAGSWWESPQAYFSRNPSLIPDSQKDETKNLKREESESAFENHTAPEINRTGPEDSNAVRPGTSSTIDTFSSEHRYDSVVSASQQESPPKIRKRFGKIGGTSARAAQQQSEESAHQLADGDMAVEDPPKAASTSAPRPKFGRIGGRKAKEQEARHQGESANQTTLLTGREKVRQDLEMEDKALDSDKGQLEEAEPAERESSRAHAALDKDGEDTRSRKRETSRERADRNRAELKREMEEKRKAPAKKKRKF